MLDYQKMMDKIIEENALRSKKPRLLLHCCCAPCASYCLEYLKDKFEITCYFYNPNITDKAEYEHRLSELKSLVSRAFYGAFEVIDGGFAPDCFYKMSAGRENIPEGGARCFDCYRLRLNAAFCEAKRGGYDYFATTLTVSPHKNAERLNSIGFEIAEGASVKYLPSDFKKKGGYSRSIALSREYGLYRQNFCGCEFSKKIAEQKAERI